MAKMLIVYYSRSGNTEAMAQQVEAGLSKVEGVETDCRAVADVSVDELLGYDGIIMGSPVYYGTMEAELKKLITSSAPDEHAEAAIIGVLNQIAPWLDGYDVAFALADKLKVIESWQGRLSATKPAE